MIFQLYTREFIPPKGGFVVRMFSKLLLLFSTHKHRMIARERLLKCLKKYNNNKSFDVADTSWLFGIFHPDSSTFWDGKCVTMRFEDAEFQCAPGWDAALRHEYGDYMQLPPEESRTWKHHPIVLDMDNEIERNLK